MVRAPHHERQGTACDGERPLFPRVLPTRLRREALVGRAEHRERLCHIEHLAEAPGQRAEAEVRCSDRSLFPLTPRDSLDERSRAVAMAFYVYMLTCADGSLYVGHTQDLEARLSAHRLRTYSGFTASRLPVNLIYSGQVSTRDEAFAP